jgi:hypothetical protein
MKVEIDIDPDVVLVGELKEQYRSLLSSIRALESTEPLLKYQVEDLKNDRKYLKAHRRVLRYNMCGDDFEAFMKETK